MQLTTMEKTQCLQQFWWLQMSFYCYLIHVLLISRHIADRPGAYIRAQGPNAQSTDYHDLSTKLYSPWGQFQLCSLTLIRVHALYLCSVHRLLIALLLIPGLDPPLAWMKHHIEWDVSALTNQATTAGFIGILEGKLYWRLNSFLLID